jgi:hypothetical protein
VPASAENQTVQPFISAIEGFQCEVEGLKHVNKLTVDDMGQVVPKNRHYPIMDPRHALRSDTSHMSDEDFRYALASLIVEALEMDTGKQERDVIDELFDSFGIKFEEIAAQVDRHIPDRTKHLREQAARRLAAAAPTAAVLLNEVVRLGARFIAMVNEIYDRLARHAATETGTSATFRFERGLVDEEQLEISPKFIEQLRRLKELLHAVDIGKIDAGAIRSLLVWDDGEFYGRWPFAVYNDDNRLPDAVLHLNWIPQAVERRASQDVAWAGLTPVVDAARESAERFVAAGEQLVRSHIAHLDELSDAQPAAAAGLMFMNESPYGFERELERFRADRTLAARARSAYFATLAQDSAIGLRADPELAPVVLTSDNYPEGTSMSALASFIAMWRLKMWAQRSREQIEAQILRSPAALANWLDWLKTSCDEAVAWLGGKDVFDVTRSVDVNEMRELIEEFLNLPLWKKRDLLYEVWTLCATLEACEQAGWRTELRGLTETDGKWVLQIKPTHDPVATLRYRADSAVSLDVWREPKRISRSGGELTPDVTVSTPSPYRRDLLIVEAKDKQKMPLGVAQSQSDAGSTSHMKNALGVAERYASGLSPRATWVCNHCAFRQKVSAITNYGNQWARVHIAAEFRPGNVPAAFSESVRAALAPPSVLRSDPESGRPTGSGLVLVVDMTASMMGFVESSCERLMEQLSPALFNVFRAVLYTDHDSNEPFLVRKLGPLEDLRALIDSVIASPRGEGGDYEEALEDAMQRCRELTEDIGPQTILVLTDAPAHRPEHCPYQIDFEAEVRALLHTGSHLHVANDRLNPQDETWKPFEAMPNFHLAPLGEFIAAE